MPKVLIWCTGWHHSWTSQRKSILVFYGKTKREKRYVDSNDFIFVFVSSWKLCLELMTVSSLLNNNQPPVVKSNIVRYYEKRNGFLACLPIVWYNFRCVTTGLKSFCSSCNNFQRVFVDLYTRWLGFLTVFICSIGLIPRRK